MTIVMVGHKGVPSRSGGIERHVEELSASLVMRGLRVISYDRKWYVGDASPVRGVLRRWSYGIKSKHLDAVTHTFTALVLAMREKPDVVHIHGVGPSLLTPIARILHPRARVVTTFHCVDRAHAKWGFVARTMLHLGEAFSCLFSHRTISVSDGLANYCLSNYECQTTVIPNGVRVHTGSQTALVESLGLKSKQYFAMITRLIPHKNVHVAIEAHQLLAGRRPELAKAYPLVIVGGSSYTDEYEKELLKLAASNPNVIMLGERFGLELNALQEHALAHLSVASSEGMSIALLESMAMGCPVIASDIPENVEVVETDAFVVRTNDAASLSHAMESALLLNQAERDAMGEKLQNRVMLRNDWDVIAANTCALYEEVCASRVLAHTMR